MITYFLHNLYYAVLNTSFNQDRQTFYGQGETRYIAIASALAMAHKAGVIN